MTTDKHEELVKRAAEWLESGKFSGEYKPAQDKRSVEYGLIRDLLAENKRLKEAMEWQNLEDIPADEKRTVILWRDDLADNLVPYTASNPEYAKLNGLKHGYKMYLPFNEPTPPKEQTR